jgi:hypothetical protein
MSCQARKLWDAFPAFDRNRTSRGRSGSYDLRACRSSGWRLGSPAALAQALTLSTSS